MSLQIATHSPSNVGNHPIQSYQNYNYAPLNSPLDPITAQIVKTQDAALEVMHLIESGAAAKFWEEQKKLPSVTWVGNLMDTLLGWGNYHPETTKKEVKTRSVNENNDEEYSNCTLPHVYRTDINTSFEALKISNNSCANL